MGTKGRKNGKVVAVACETEPVSKVQDFRTLAQTIPSLAKQVVTPTARSPPTGEGRAV